MRASWWCITAHTEKNMCTLNERLNVPQCVKAIYGGNERGSETDKLHGQFAVHTFQSRAAVIADWLPGSHIEKAKSAVAARKYAMKSDTAVGEKTVWENPDVDDYMTMDVLLELLAKNILEWKPHDSLSVKKLYHAEFWYGVSSIIKEKPALISVYSQPQMYRAWENTREVWIQRAKSIVLLPAFNEDNKPEIKNSPTNINEDLPSSSPCQQAQTYPAICQEACSTQSSWIY